MKLFMLLLGCKPHGRHIEQHDIFFAIGDSLKSLIPDIVAAWPEAQGKIHIDAWREVNCVDGYSVKVSAKMPGSALPGQQVKLFFINLGGYKENEFEEFHYKMLMASESKLKAIRRAKESAFYKHTGFAGANSHIDDKYGVDVDDIFEIEDILPPHLKENYAIAISPEDNLAEDRLHMGYFRLDKL